MEKGEYEMAPFDDHESTTVQPWPRRKSSSLNINISRIVSVVSFTFKVVAVVFIVLQSFANYKIEHQLAKESSEMSNNNSLILEELADVKELLSARRCIENTTHSKGQLTESEVNTVRYLLNLTELHSVSVSELKEELSREIQQSVEIFKHCDTTERTCTVHVGTNEKKLYWKACSTEFLPKDIPDYFTISRDCAYESHIKKYSENINLFEENGQVRCDCDVRFPGSTGPENRLVETTNGKCTLRILRCPTSINLFG